MPAYTNKVLYEAIKELNIVDQQKLDSLYSQAEEQNLELSKLLIDDDLVTEENLGRLISDLVGFQYIKLSQVHIPENVLKIIPENFAEKYKVICFRLSVQGLDVAMNDPQNKEVVEMIEKKSQKKVNIYYALGNDISDALSLYKQDIQNVFKDIFAGTPNDNLSVDQVLSTLLEYAYDSKASDIHIEPTDDSSVIRYRIDGVLREIVKIPRNLHEQVINKIKVESKLRTDEHFAAQDGKMRYKSKSEVIDIRVSVVPLIKGEDCVMRLLTSHARQYGLNDLGLSDSDHEKVKAAFKKPYGMILSTGPTGSGKTTTMYSILKELNTRVRNITTIEDPVEYDIYGIYQIQVNHKSNLTFAEGLKSILRQDPDTIFVGEIRD
jgi:type IV pilus assembly protein PilB